MCPAFFERVVRCLDADLVVRADVVVDGDMAGVRHVDGSVTPGMMLYAFLFARWNCPAVPSAGVPNVDQLRCSASVYASVRIPHMSDDLEPELLRRCASRRGACP